MAVVGNGLLNAFVCFVLPSWRNYWHLAKFDDLRSILAIATPIRRQGGVFINSALGAEPDPCEEPHSGETRYKNALGLSG